MGNPILYIVIPCYNEEAVLPLTSGMFLKKIKDLAIVRCGRKYGEHILTYNIILFFFVFFIFFHQVHHISL